MRARAKDARLRLDHIGIAVPDLENARLQFSRLLGKEPTAVETVPSEGVRTCFIEVEGCRVELLEAISADSPIAKFLDRGRSGVHHLAFAVEGVGLERYLQDLRSSGVEVIGEEGREGSEHSKVFFVHPRAASGVLIEFTQKDAQEGESA